MNKIRYYIITNFKKNTKMKKMIWLFFVIGIVTYACDKANDDNTLNCGDSIIIDKNLYDSTNTNGYSVINAKISNDCLEIEIRASGCDGESWIIKLIDSKDITESLPLQKFIKISLKNEELCEKIISKKLCFDLKPIRIDNNNQIELNLEKWEDPLIYSY